MLEKSVPLNPRELEVASFVWRDLMNKQIAWEMGISEHTVKAHMKMIKVKLGVQGRVGVALWFERNKERYENTCDRRGRVYRLAAR